MRMLAALLLALFLQPAPTLTAAWDGPDLAVTWQGGEANTALYLDGAYIPDAIGPAGAVRLRTGGGDGRYSARVGALLELRVGQTTAAALTVPPHVMVLPVVAKE